MKMRLTKVEKENFVFIKPSLHFLRQPGVEEEEDGDAKNWVQLPREEQLRRGPVYLFPSVLLELKSWKGVWR